MANVDQEYINKMYDSSLASQKDTLQQDYEQSISNLEAEQKKAQQQTDANLNRTYVEAAKAAKNYGEVQNAYGLSSGAMAQAKLVQDNQLQSNLTAIRAAQQETDAEVERQRNLLAKEYASAISQAQADNDLARAQALYEQAKEAEAQLMQQQKEAASMLGAAGDFSMHGTAYGMSADQVAALEKAYAEEIAKQQAAEEAEKQLAAAELMASVGDYSLLAQMYGLTAEQAARLGVGGSGYSTGGSGSGGYDYKPTKKPGEEEEDTKNVIDLIVNAHKADKKREPHAVLGM